MLHIPAVVIDAPAFWKGVERNAGIVLDDDAAVVEQEIAHAGKPLRVHQVGGGFEQRHAWTARGTPSKEFAAATREIGPEIIKRLRRCAVAAERDLHAVSRRTHVDRVIDRVAEPR